MKVDGILVNGVQSDMHCDMEGECIVNGEEVV